MSVDLLAPGTTLQRRAQLELKSKLPFSFRAGDGRVALTDDGAGADITYLYDRHDRAGTFTRGTTSGWVTSRNGKMSQAPTNFPLLDYWDHRSSGVYDVSGIRIGPQRTNLLLRSEEFDNASWTKTDTTVSANVLPVSPKGDVTADQLTEGTAGTAVVSQAVTVSAGATVAHSRFIRRGNHDWVQLTVFNGSDAFRGWFNLATGVVGSTAVSGTGVVSQAYMYAVPTGGYRCVVVGSLPAITAYTCSSASASADASTTRVNNAQRLEWGAQAEAGDWATAYVPTTTATVTANKDDLRFTFPWPVQALSFYLRFTEVGQKYSASTGILASICLNATSTTDPRLSIYRAAGGAGYAVSWDPGTETTATLAALPSLHQSTELLVTLDTSGVATLYQSLAEAATTSAVASAQSLPATTTYFGNSQANARLVIGDIGASGTAPGALSLQACKVDWGVKTMAFMRAAA